MLKIGLIGAGHLGKIHLKLLKQIELWNVVGFYDADPAVRQAVEQEFGVKAFDQMDELIDLCDAVDVVTPTVTHYDCASRVLKKSKHLFIEKPITTTIEEAKSLIHLANEAKVKGQVGHVERFNPAFEAARPYCSHPMFVEAHRLAQFNPRGTDVSVVLDLMIHDIDVVLSVVKSTIKRISASGVAVVSDTPDIANARIEFDNGCVANLTASRISMKNMRKARFFQRDAYISIDFLEKEVNVVRLKNVTGDQDDPFSVILDLGENKGKKQIYFETPKPAETNAIKMELESFYHAIKTGSNPPVTLQDGYNALDVANKIIDKLKRTGDFLEA
jgi:predicted dehydrogenase